MTPFPQGSACQAKGSAKDVRKKRNVSTMKESRENGNAARWDSSLGIKKTEKRERVKEEEKSGSV